MAGYVPSALNDAVDGVAAKVTHISLHTADPGDTGASEVTGTGYARQAVTFAAASGGERVGSASDFTVPASTTIRYLGFWTAATGGTFKGGFILEDDQGTALPNGEVYSGAGRYTPSPRLRAVKA